MAKDTKPKTGDILSYTREVDIFVIDEKGSSVPCSNMAEAKILSLLFEIKESLKNKNGR